MVGEKIQTKKGGRLGERERLAEGSCSGFLLEETGRGFTVPWKMGIWNTTKHVWWPKAIINKKSIDFRDTFNLMVKPCTIQTMLDIGYT